MDWLKRVRNKREESESAEPQTVGETFPVPVSAVPEAASSRGEAEQAADAPVEQPVCPSVDASVEIKIAADGMSATAILHGPTGEGAHITPEAIYEELTAKNITYGLAKPIILLKAKGHKYEELFQVAAGTTPKDGQDGQIIELVAREKTASFVENAYGNVDYKDLNMINQIHAGTVICELIPPVAPEPGMNIYGAAVPGRPGIPSAVPQGDNTVLSDDGTKLIAGVDGNLIYQKNRFHVKQVLEIAGDVGMSTGNIQFTGDVVVKGSVFEGYKIVAGGNVTVYGIVEGVFISAGGNIDLKQGINGMGKGTIEAKGTIHCRYLESCTARAGGSISAEAIIHSSVFSGDTISVVGGRSSIIGGICSAMRAIDVKTIGSRMSTMTSILLGATTEMIEERRNLNEEISELEKRIQAIALDVRFIEERIASRSLTDKHKTMLQELQVEYPVVTSRLEECRQRMTELETLLSDNLNCRLNCSHMFPPVRISIGSDTMLIQEDRNRCIVHYVDGEIRFSYT